MPDEIKQNPASNQPPAVNKTAATASAAKTTATAAAGATAAEEPKAEPPKPISLADDLVQLDKLNLMRAVMLRFQGGRHPNAEIDALLQRRLDFKREDFQGPYAIRLICTLMMIFLLCVIFWGLIWLFATALQLNEFLRLMSTGVATLMAAAAGVAIFHPSSVPDEKLVKETVVRRMTELRDSCASLKAGENPGKSESPGAAAAAANPVYEPGSEPGTFSEEENKSEADSETQSQLDAVAPGNIEQ